MKLSDRYNLKTLIIVLTVIYLIAMNSLEGYILSAIFGSNYMDNYLIYHRSYELFIWILPTQLFICYVYKLATVKKLKSHLILVSLGLWLFLIGFTFL